MSPGEDLEAALRRALASPPPEGRLDDLDRRVAEALARPPGPRGAGRLRRAAAATRTLAATAVVLGVLVVALSFRPPQGVPGGSPASTEGMTTASGGPATPSASHTSAGVSSPPASPTVAAPSPITTPTSNPAGTGAPTRAPTAPPTTAPSPSAPVPDPEPEGTPRIFSASGPLGQALTVNGVTVTMYETATPPQHATTCDYASRETRAYAFRMDWTNPPASIEPWIALGANPHNVVTFEPGWAVNTALTVILCHAPGDTESILVESSPPGSPMTLYRWYFG